MAIAILESCNIESANVPTVILRFLVFWCFVFSSSVYVAFFASFQLKIKGYNSKQIVLLRKIVERMVTLEITQDRFDIVKERVCLNFLLNLR